MEYLKSAVASAISKGPPFPYTFGDRADVEDSIWAIHNGLKKEDGSKCSIFAFDVNANKSRLPLAKNALRKLRTLRHPGVVKILDTVETDTYIYIATERITPLSWYTKRQALNTETIKWGLYSVASTLKFINEEATSIHGSVRVSSIFTTESGEWKLAGFEVLSSVKEEDPTIYTYGGLVIDSGRYASPEVVKGGWQALKNQPTHAIDSWNFGTLVYEIFNGTFSNSEQLSQPKAIPPVMTMLYKRLVQTSPRMRISIAQFLEQAKRPKGLFDTPLIRCSEFVENMGVKNEVEREEFLQNLEETKEEFPEEFFKAKILPELLKSVEFGGGGPKVFAVVLSIAEKLTDEEWEKDINPFIVRLFASPDRMIRVFLLENMSKFIEHLPKNLVSNSIFPQLTSGFSDVAPVIREQTVKSILVIIDKLTDRQINGDLLKYLAKTQNDEQPGIRTNTTICLGKIARNLGTHTRSKVLVAAFTRSLRDPFVHARNAALLALAATADVFDDVDCSTRCLPAICPALIDKEKIIRTQAAKTLEIFLQRIRSLTASMPDSALPPTGSEPGNATPRIGNAQQDESWAGWAISSFTKKLNVAGQLETRPSPGPTEPSTPQPTADIDPLSNKQAVVRDSYISKPQVSMELPDENEDEDMDPWGDMDETPSLQTNADTASRQPSAFSSNTTRPSTERMNTEDEIIASFAAKPKPALPKGLARKTPLATTTKTSSTIGPKSTTIGNKTTTVISGKKPVVNSNTSKTGNSSGLAPKAKSTVQPEKKTTKGDGWGEDDGWDEEWK